MTADPDALLVAQGISVRRGPRVVLEPCDVSINVGETIAVYGPNGAGKSTLLQALAGLIPASGRISFCGREFGRDLSLLEYHRRTAAVFQEPLLLRGTVRYNVRLGLQLRGENAGRETEVDGWLQRLRIAHLTDRPVGALSGGEAQRTSLARALILKPEVLFLDEPFAALDAPTRSRLTEELADLLVERRMATLLVSHDIDEAAALCERCIILDKGCVLQHDAMHAVLQRPISRRVAEIIGLSNIGQGTIADSGPDGTRLAWNGHQLLAEECTGKPGSRVDFVIRQELMRLHTAPDRPTNCVPGTIERIRRRGQSQIVSIRVGNPDLLHVRAGAHDEPREGEDVRVSFAPEAIWIMPT